MSTGTTQAPQPPLLAIAALAPTPMHNLLKTAATLITCGIVSIVHLLYAFSPATPVAPTVPPSSATTTKAEPKPAAITTSTLPTLPTPPAGPTAAETTAMLTELVRLLTAAGPLLAAAAPAPMTAEQSKQFVTDLADANARSQAAVAAAIARGQTSREVLAPLAASTFRDTLHVAPQPVVAPAVK
jgi:hypothetical protein